MNADQLLQNSDRLAKRVGIDTHHPNYDYLQTLNRYELMKKYWHEVDEFNRENQDKDYTNIKISLPLFKDIDRIIEERINKKRN